MGQCCSSGTHEGPQDNLIGMVPRNSFKADGTLSTLIRKSVDGTFSTTPTRKRVDGKPSTTSTRKSVDRKLSNTSTRKPVDGKPSITSTWKSVDRKLWNTSTRKSVDGRPSNASTRKSVDSNATEDCKAEAVSDGFSSEDYSRVVGHHRMSSREDVVKTVPQELEWHLLLETRRGSFDRRKSRSRDSPLRPPSAMSSPKVCGNDHSGDSPGRRWLDRILLERKSVDRKSVGRRSVDRKSVDRKSVERRSVDRKSVERTPVDKRSLERTLIERKLVARESVERKLEERRAVERTIADGKNVKSIRSLDRMRGFSPDQTSKSLRTVMSSNDHFNRRGRSPGNLTFVPESGIESVPVDFGFLVEISKKASQARIDGKLSVLANQSYPTDSHTSRDSRRSRELDEIRKSYRKSASKAAARDLNAFKSMSSSEFSNDLSINTVTTD